MKRKWVLWGRREEPDQGELCANAGDLLWIGSVFLHLFLFFSAIISPKKKNTFSLRGLSYWVRWRGSHWHHLWIYFVFAAELTPATGSENTEALPQEGSHYYLWVLGDTWRHKDAPGREPGLTHLSSVEASGTLYKPCTTGIMACRTASLFHCVPWLHNCSLLKGNLQQSGILNI